MKKLGIIVCFIFGINGCLFSDVVTQPDVNIAINGQWWTVPLVQTSATTWGTDNSSTYENGDASIQIQQLTLDVDPSITYGITVTNSMGAPASFAFSFMLPITLPAGPTTVSSSLGVSLTDGSTPEDGVLLTSFLSPSIQQSFVNGIDAGVDLGSLPLAFSAGPPDTHVVSYFTGPTSGPAGPASTIKIMTSFTLSDSGDVASVSGRFNLIPAPEPSTYMLVLIGAIFLVLWQRRVS